MIIALFSLLIFQHLIAQQLYNQDLSISKSHICLYLYYSKRCQIKIFLVFLLIKLFAWCRLTIFVKLCCPRFTYFSIKIPRNEEPIKFLIYCKLSLYEGIVIPSFFQIYFFTFIVITSFVSSSVFEFSQQQPTTKTGRISLLLNL